MPTELRYRVSSSFCSVQCDGCTHHACSACDLPVLAAQSGRMREICSDGYQSLIEIQHADERQTYYLHITLSLSVRRQLLDHAVRRGQYLGELIGQSYFRTPCGQGSSRHLHFAVSDRAMIIERFPLEGIAASASCCANPPVYRSTNLRVDLAS